MRFDLARVTGVEFAVDERVQQDVGLVAGHFGGSCSAEPGRAQHAARARQPRHHGPDRGADHLGDLAVGEIIDVAQHDRLAERLRPSASTSR